MESIRQVQLVAARLKELQAVQNLLSSQNATKLAFQNLPIHMRRRAMSAVVKRVPKRIRAIHTSQLQKSGMPPKQKRPSRKYRRRVRLLNDEIVRRQRRVKWLETHVWHAKRFHIQEKWLYKIPYSSTCKSFRACYRAVNEHCLIQDISYYGCIEVKGDMIVIYNQIKRLTKPSEGLSMSARAFTCGMREGDVMVHKIDGGPPIGRVLFTWMPTVTEKSNSVIWMWAHPAYFTGIFNELTTLFKELSPGIEINDLRYELNRFRLMGPLSQAVLNKALKPINVSLPTENWLTKLLDNEDQRQIFSDQLAFWNEIKDIQTPSLLSPKIAIQLIVVDPRYVMPDKRTKAVNFKQLSGSGLPPNNLSAGPIWDKDIRNIVTSSKITDAALNKLRSDLLVPGSSLEYQGSAVPIMLIQRPGMSKTGFGCGWDVIVPKGWARALWRCLIMWGGRAGGYREMENINFECGSELLLPPDTPSGMREETVKDETNKIRYFKLPPNKRPNFNQFSSSSPFCCNWQILVKDWTGCESPIQVLRDRTVLTQLQTCLQNRKELLKIQAIDGSYLIPIRIVPKKGTLQRYTMICLPNSTDLKSKSVTEPHKVDVYKEERNRLRKEHKKTLQRLKKKRHVARKKGRCPIIDKAICSTFMETMRKLWLPEINSDIRTSSSREIIGFIVQGGVSYINGKCHGIGYIPLTALRHFLATYKENQVLFRHPAERLYRAARLEIIT